MTITPQDLQARLSDLIMKTDRNDTAARGQTLQAFLQWCAEHYDELDEEAKTKTDNVFKMLQEELATAVNALPDGPQKRTIIRELGIIKGEHYSAARLLEGLRLPSQISDLLVVAEGSAIVVEIIQQILDMLFDMTRHTHRGIAMFANIGLCYWAVDELLVALHLSQRAYTNQAYTHLRTVWEVLDKIELFLEQPEWADLWAKGSDKDVWNELKPSEVRKKLKHAKYDPLYSFFSELGPHSTFKGLQARTGKKIEQPDPHRIQAVIWVGGCPQEHHVIWTMTSCAYAAMMALLKCTSVCSAFLNDEEFASKLDVGADRVAGFIRQHYAEWAKHSNMENVDELINLLDRKPWKLFSS
jgi:hypothetical protein